MTPPRNSSANVQFHLGLGARAVSPPSGANIHPISIFPTPVTQDSFYFRSAHRNEAEFMSSSIGGNPNTPGQFTPPRTIDNDAAVSRNYQRLVSDSIDTLWGSERTSTTFGEYRQEMIGKISDALEYLFPGLRFTGVGAPLNGGTFRFDKGVSEDFPYRDLSGGEKAAFDILLDILARQNGLSNSVMCIDEPEAHLNSRVHGDLLSTLFENVKGDSQLWIASHSIGMMRRARDLAQKHPNEVVFLDFEGHDFDTPVVMSPVHPDRELWKRALKIALDDIEDLVAPEHIVICEGEASRGSLDADCYTSIFGHTHPETQFVPGGSNNEVATDNRGYAYLVGLLTPGTKVTRVRDRDDMSASEMLDALPLRILPQRNIESYLYGDGVLERFCESRESGSWKRIKPQVDQAVADSIDRTNPADDRKSCSGPIYNLLKRELGLTGKGNSAIAFAKEMLVQEITPGTAEYAELDAAIFGT